ncbi:MAG: hypothetical protein JNL34_04000 [Anaerolineae bacterium]|nr:hypothetical protein [Anaerolineae bacterium]
MGVLEICIVIFVLIIGLPLLFRLLKSLGPLIAVLIGLAIVLGVVWLAVNLVGSVVSTAVNLLFGPLGLLLIGGAAAYIAYQQWQKRQIGRPGGARHDTYTWDEKPKRDKPPIEIGDDGEIVTLDELLDEEQEKKKRQ